MILNDLFWKALSSALGALAVSFIIAWWVKDSSYDTLELKYEKCIAEGKVLEIQKEALIKGIETQNIKVREYELNEKRNLEEYSENLDRNSKTLEEQLKISSKLRTEKEVCDYMVRRSYEILAD